MNWIDRIKKAIKRGRFTDIDVDKSNCYETCAVGEVFKIRISSELYDKFTKKKHIN